MKNWPCGTSNILFINEYICILWRVHMTVCAPRFSCFRSVLDYSTNVANESIASKTIPRRKNIVLCGTIGSGWEEGS